MPLLPPNPSIAIKACQTLIKRTQNSAAKGSSADSRLSGAALRVLKTLETQPNDLGSLGSRTELINFQKEDLQAELNILNYKIEESSSSNQKLNYLQKIARQTLNVLFLIEHWAEYQEKSEEELKQDPHFIEEFSTLVLSGDQNAVRAFNAELKKQSLFAMQILWLIAPYNKKWEQKLKDSLDNEEVQVAFNSLLKMALEHEIDTSFIEAFISFQRESELVWAMPFLKDFFYAEPEKSFQSPFLRSLLSDLEMPYLFNLVIQMVDQGNSFCLEIMKRAFIHFKSPSLSEKPFIIFWIQRAKLDLPTFTSLISVLSIASDIHNDTHLIEQVMGPYKGKEAFELKLRLYISQWSKDLILDLKSNLKKRHLNPKFNYRAAPFSLKAQLIKALLEQRIRLTHFLVTDEPMAVLEPPFLETQHKPESLLFGLNPMTPKIAVDMAKLCENQRLPLLFPDRVEFKFKEPHQGVKTSFEVGFWLRDPFIATASDLKLTHFDLFQSTAAESVYQARIDHFENESAKTYHVARVFEIGLEQIYVAESLLAFDFAQQVQKKRNLHTLPQFTSCYVEGGNVLFGQEVNPQGKLSTYAIVGSDSFTLTKTQLTVQIAKMGVVPRSRGRWMLSQPTKDSSHYLKVSKALSDDLIEEMIAHDLGVDKVYKVMQCDFHLDMKMCLADPLKKKVLLNSSPLSAKASSEFSDHQKQKFTPETLEQRKIFLNDESSMRHYYEEQCKKDLERQGFEVVEVAGHCYELTEDNYQDKAANFFNHLLFLNEEGELCAITGGAHPFFKSRFQEVFSEHMPHIKHFFEMDKAETQKLLSLHGSIRCLGQFTAK